MDLIKTFLLSGAHAVMFPTCTVLFKCSSFFFWYKKVKQLLCFLLLLHVLLSVLLLYFLSLASLYSSLCLHFGELRYVNFAK